MTKALSIKIENSDVAKAAIQNALDAVQGTRNAAVETAASVMHCAKEAEEMLEDLDLPASYRSGAVLKFHQAGPSASSYRYPRKTTFLTLRRKKDGWHVTGIDTVDVYPKQAEHKKLWLTATQDEVVKRRFTSQYQVMTTAA
jgi:hypothetical protein